MWGRAATHRITAAARNALESGTPLEPKVGLLVVDDDPMMRQLLRRSLAREDRVVEVVGSGVAALDRLRDADIQLMVLDLGLPDMSGLEVLDRVQEASPRTDVIVVTANDAVPVVVDALRRGAVDFLVKPVSLDALVPRVDRLLQMRQMRLESDVATIMRRLASIRDVGLLVPRVEEAARDATQADQVTLFLWDGQALEAVSGPPAKGHAPVARAVIEDGGPKRVPGNAGQMSVLAWPLVAHHEAIGVIAVSRRRGRAPFSFEAERKLSIVATGSALEIDRARLVQRLQEQVDELVKTRNQLSAAGQAQGIAALATGYAHELQGPLQAVQSQVRGALSSMDDPKDVAQHLRYALEGIARIQAAVGDLSLLGRNRDDTEMDAVRLVGLAHRMANLGGGMPVRIEPAEASVRGNVGLYTQTLAELLRNAARACRDVRDPSIVVRIAEADELVHIAIQDNGHGIPRHVAPRVFEPFFTTWEGHVGAGLGRVNSVVRDVGGKLVLEPGESGGTVATVMLPAGEQIHDLFAFGDGSTLNTEFDTETDEFYDTVDRGD